MSNASYATEKQAFERHRVRGNWNISPLWEGKMLLGVLKQQGLVGKGLVKAFDRLAPKIVGASRLDLNHAYTMQTGRELSDYILVQQADKAVRYSQLPPEAENFRLAVARSVSSQNAETDTSGSDVYSSGDAGNETITRSLEAKHLSGAHSSSALLSTNELANLTGFAPKTIRRWASRRLLNFIRVGNQFRFRPAAVELFLAQHEIRK